MCTTPSSFTSTGEARPPMARSTLWTDADTRWRYSMVSRQLYTVTNQLSQQAGAVQPPLHVSVLSALLLDAHSQHEVHPSEFDSGAG